MSVPTDIHHVITYWYTRLSEQLEWYNLYDDACLRHTTQHTTIVKVIKIASETNSALGEQLRLLVNPSLLSMLRWSFCSNTDYQQFAYGMTGIAFLSVIFAFLNGFTIIGNCLPSLNRFDIYG